MLVIGNDVQPNDLVHIGAAELVQIGDNTLIASRVFFTDHCHGMYDRQDIGSGPEVAPVERAIVAKPVHIDRNVWLGEQVCILPGVTIGERAVIKVGSVVTQDIPARCVDTDRPARPIRRPIRKCDETTLDWRWA